MPKIDSTKFYANAIKKYGRSARGVNWLSQENQTIRFAVIAKLLPTNLQHCSLADAGCGFGDFYHYLQTIKKNLQTYTGIDSHPQMVAVARETTKQTILHLDICKASLPIHDYYICSGALNVLTPFESHLFIQNCYHSSREAFIFNVLYGDKTSDTYNYLQKETLESIAKKLDVKKVVYKEGYLENDITVMFVKK